MGGRLANTFHTMGLIALSFLWIMMPSLVLGEEGPPLTVKGFHIEEVGAQTRITFSLSQAHPLDLEEDVKKGLIVVKGPEGVQWSFEEEVSLVGLVKKYERLSSPSGGEFLSFETIPGTEIDDYGNRKNSSGEPEFYVDLRQSGDIAAALEQKNPPKEALYPQEALKTPLKVEPPQSIKKLMIFQQEGHTMITLETPNPIKLGPELNLEQKKLFIDLPKVNWLKVDTKIDQKGLITRFYADESCKDKSRLALTLREDVVMQDYPPTKEGDSYFYQFQLSPVIEEPAPEPEQEDSTEEVEDEEMDEEEEEEPIILPKKRKKAPVFGLRENSPFQLLSVSKAPQESTTPASDLMEDEGYEEQRSVQDPSHEMKDPEDVSLPNDDTQRDHLQAPEGDAQSSAISVPQETLQKPQTSQNTLRIEGDEETLHAEELKEDLKGLQISLSLPENVAYVNRQDLKKDNLKEGQPKVLKSFKIAPSDDIEAIASKPQKPRHLNLSNAGTMFTRLQKMQEPQASHEGTAPAWVIEAKMKEKKL